MAREDAVRKSISTFTANFYGKLVEEQDVSLPNVVLSPFSLYRAMAMTAAGTNGPTRSQILAALDLPILVWADKPHERIDALVRKLITPSKDFDVIMLNRLFILGSTQIEQEFVHIMTDFYDTAFESLSGLPDDETRRAHMNDWVSVCTQQRLKELIPTNMLLTENTVKVVSILCFKGCWESTFQTSDSKDFAFVGLNGVRKPCVPMHGLANVMHTFLPKYGADLLRIPLKDSGWDVLFLIPKNHTGLPQLLAHLRKPGELLNLLNQSPAVQQMHIYFPAFQFNKIEPLYAGNLLKKCGATFLFDETKSDLSGICTNVKLSVSGVIHQVTFGVETPIACELISESPVQSDDQSSQTCATIRVQHPFFFAVVCDRNVPLLVGHVTTPTAPQ